MHYEHQKQRAEDQVAVNFELNTGCIQLNIAPNLVKADVMRNFICKLILYDKIRANVKSKSRSNNLYRLIRDKR